MLSDLALDDQRDGMIEVIESCLSNKARAAKIVTALRGATSKTSLLDAVKLTTSGERMEIESEIGRLEAELGPIERRRAYLERCSSAYGELLGWGGFRLGRVDESLFHKVHEADILCAHDDRPIPPEIAEARKSCGVFLVQHDWASLIASAEADDGGFRLPFEHTCFEFNISGRRVCFLASCVDGEPYQYLPLIRTRDGWVLGDAQEDLTYKLQDQVRAIAITLDAAVVRADVVRAPYKLNVARAAKGRVPLYDYHILSLARPQRAVALPREGAPIHHKRLHFRRGHWRHYENHKTWIKWMLVGDAALGFADKDYRL